MTTNAFANLPIRAFTIPDKVSSIEGNAFEGCDSLGNIQFGETSQLTAIFTHAFANLPISGFTIPDKDSIEANAFEGCDFRKYTIWRKTHS